MTTAEEPGAEPPRVGFIGKRLGRFWINAELGRGGMATVYRAHDPQLGRDVAVKVMHGFFAGRPDIEARFKREANAVAAIKHPSILALYDFAPPAGEEPGYIVSELIEGPGLRQLLDARGGRLLPEVAVLIAIRVADALGAAHAAGIVHRDVKPDNVLIDRAGGGARIVLTDFGVAHVSGLDTMTATGAVLGSPAYMSPEQARSEDVGPQSDVFSLGVLLYQLCTGHLPFSGKDPFMVIAALLRGDYLSPAKIEARVGPDLEHIIARCLAAAPAARFSDGGAVAAALREWLAPAKVGDEEGALRAMLCDPDAFERQVSSRIARVAVTAAESARRRGQIPRALAEVGRALAYAPDDPEACALLGRVGAHRRARWIQLGIAMTGATVIIGSGLLIGVHRRAQLGRDALRTNPALSTGATPTVASPVMPAVPVLPIVPGLPARPRAQESPRASEPDVRKAVTPPGSTGPGAAPSLARRPPIGRSPRIASNARAASDQRGAAATLPTSRSATLEPGTPARDETRDEARDEVPDRVAPLPPPSTTLSPATPTGAARASLELRASRGFCEPSLDQYPPGQGAKYPDLPPGPHVVYCTLPQGGPKEYVTTYVLRPGTRPSLTVVPGPDGRPMLGRAE